ncbi:putative Prefoldin subunit 2 [Hypsibius exemplaris]|uniref:Prefoldin subunit 2 n=1 Tax=Hypsibius exemplaris TaxID=2072580 RepID=A0A9X6RLV8_HYPEX|nr:putative Prefoldin subunit 2 [Hypsibius exemplaris]
MAAEGDAQTSKVNTELIVSGFSKLRQEQATLGEKLAELEADLNEHTLVLQMLEKLEPDRKCFRRVGGALVEKTVKEVVPAIGTTKTQITATLKALREQLDTKTKELLEYKKTHRIVVRGVDAPDMPYDELVAS